MHKVRFQGILEISTCDWPHNPCCLVFLQGCNLRCPWCQNVSCIEPAGGKEATVEDLCDRVVRLKPIVDSVMLTGGEPLLQGGACLQLAKTCRQLGMKVGMETNGTFPEELRKLLPYLDFVAMDIKAPLSDPLLYQRVAGTSDTGITSRVSESLEILAGSGCQFDVRTTVVPTLNDSPEVIERLARDIQGLARSICLQQFRNLRTLDPSFEKIKPPPREKLIELGRLVKKYLPEVRIFTKETGFESIY